MVYIGKLSYFLYNILKKSSILPINISRLLKEWSDEFGQTKEDFIYFTNTIHDTTITTYWSNKGVCL